MASQVTLKALGLNYSPNNLALPEGSLLVANDVIVRRDNVVESRRGFKDYSQLFDTSTPVKQLLQYKQRIISHYSNKIAFDTLEQDDNGQNIFSNFLGNYNETEDGLRIKSIIANQNLYFTTSDGIKKISAKSSDDFPNTQIVNAGAVKALDFTVELDIQQGQTSGFFPVDSTVAYRTLWGYQDANENFIYGTPSERNVIYNYLSDVIPLDFNTLLNQIDNLNQPGSMINDANYYETYKLSLSDTAEMFKTNVLGLAEKLDKDILYADLNLINPGDAPLTIDSLQVNVGSVGQINFPITQDPSQYFQENEYIQIEGFNSEPSTTSISLTNVGGSALFPENPVSITTSPNTLVNNRNVTISGATTNLSVNGTYTATVDEKNILSTSSGGQINTVTIESGVSPQRNISSATAGTVCNLSILHGNVAESSVTNISNYTTSASIQTVFKAASGIFPSAAYYYEVTIPYQADVDALIIDGDLIKLTGVVGPLIDGGSYRVNGKTVGANIVFYLCTIASYPTPITGTSGYSVPSITVSTTDVLFTLSSNHSMTNSNLGFVNISGSNITYNTGTSLNGDLSVTYVPTVPSVSTTQFCVYLTAFLDAFPATPNYGIYKECLKFNIDSFSGSAIVNGNMIKIIGLVSTPSLYSSSVIDNSKKLFVNSLSGSTFYLVDSLGNKISVSGASIVAGTALQALKFIQVTTTTNHIFAEGKLIKFSGSGSPLLTALSGKTFRVYNPTANTFQILPNVYISASSTAAGVVDACLQLKSIGSALNSGDGIYIQPGFTATPAVSSGEYFAQEVEGDFFYISQYGYSIPNLITNTSWTNTPTINKGIVIETTDDHNFLKFNYVTISNATVPEGINGSWKITNIVSSKKFTILPLASTSYTATSGYGNVNRVTIPVSVDSVTVGTGVVNSTIGKNLKQFNGNFQITSVVAPNATEKGYIQFLLPNNAESFTSTIPDPSSNKDANAKIYSYDYRNIVNSTDINFATTLNNLTVSEIATSEQLRNIQNNISRIANRLKTENTGVIPTNLLDSYIKDYQVTLYANTKLKITVPEGINKNYFYQIYRTRVFTAQKEQTLGSLGDVPVIADDEMQLVYEAYPPYPFQISVDVIDSYPEDLALTNQALYTNQLTGAGITQANDIPPLAKDINVFKNTTFYSNTKTKQRLNPFQLFGTSGINSNNNDKITIGNEFESKTYIFNPGVQELVSTRFNYSDSAATIESNIKNKYIIYNTPTKKYYAWFRYNREDITFTGVTASVGSTSFTTTYNHNLTSGSKVLISGLVSSIDINSEHEILVTSPNTFEIAVNCGINITFYSAKAVPSVTDAIPIRVDLNTGDTAQICGVKLSNNVGSEALDFITSNSLNIVNIEPSNPTGTQTTITTVYPHGLSLSDSVVISGVQQQTGTSLNGTFSVISVTDNQFVISTPIPATGVNIDSAQVTVSYISYINNFDEGICLPPTTNALGSIVNSVQIEGAGEDENTYFDFDLVSPCTASIGDVYALPLQITGIEPGSPYTIVTTSIEHGLNAGDGVTISGVTQSGGTPLNGNAIVVEVSEKNSFTISTGSTPTGVVYSSGKVIVDKNKYTIVKAPTPTNLLTKGQRTPQYIGDLIRVVGTGSSTIQFSSYVIEPPKILLSQVGSRSQAIDITARSMARVINKQYYSPVYAFYISGDESSPGILNLESKNLTDPIFYVMANGTGIGQSFTPDVSPAKEISSAVTPVITGSGTLYTLTSNDHNLKNYDKIIISGSNCVPTIDGIYTITVTNPNEFTITSNLSFISNGSYFAYSTLTDCTSSTNEEKLNRIYYSKTDQPEAVPISNYFPVGSSDKQILRIVPIRDSLFVFKEDGLYRISGEQAPFVVTLFDTSCVVTAPDSVSISNNVIYAWTVKGISNITESGVGEISRPIDTEILKIGSNQYANFKKLTWGIGYDSDNSYTVFTNKDTTDEYATIGFRYSNLTNTWTNITKPQNCGIILSGEDKLYTGGSNEYLIYQERKNFNRTDYSDNDFNLTIVDGNITNTPNKPVGTRIYFQSTDDVSPGDVITQTQILTHYLYNSLLDKLDLDPTVGKSMADSIITLTNGISTIHTQTPHGLNADDYLTISNSNTSPSLDGIYQVIQVFDPNTFEIQLKTSYVLLDPLNPFSCVVKRNYSETLHAETGDSLRNKILELAQYLDTDPTLNYQNYFNDINTSSGLVSYNTATDPTIVVTNIPNTLIDGRLVTFSGNPSVPISEPTLQNKTYQITIPSFFGKIETELNALFGPNYYYKVTIPYDAEADSLIDNFDYIKLNLVDSPLTDGVYIAYNKSIVTTPEKAITFYLADEFGNLLVGASGYVDNSALFASGKKFSVPVSVITAGVSGLTYNTLQNQNNELDIQVCFNKIIDNLNLDPGRSFLYKKIETPSVIEAVILGVDYQYNFIDVNLPLPWTDGIVTIYKSIPCELIYSPLTFGDPLSIKQIYEATMMFDNKAFTKAKASFNTDIKPQFISVDFYGQGNGIFGHYSDPGFGYGFFGGLSNSAPFRTIIPRQTQRCRYLTVKFEHNVAREKWALNGITLTGNVGLSTRGYR